MSTHPFRFLLLLLLLSLAALALASGCDTSIDSFAESERAYSLFGYLDANADTQFVRIEPLQDTTFAGSESVDARVTATNRATGNTIVWRDSVTDLNFGSGEALPVHNFFATGGLEPGATYRFRAERQGDGAASTAEVTLPPSFPPIEVVQGADTTMGSEKVMLRVEGVERLGAVVARYDYRACIPIPQQPPDCYRRKIETYHLSDTTRVPGGLQIEFSWRADVPENQSAALDTLYSFQVTVASVSEDWPTYAEGNAPGGGVEGQPLPPPGINSNVENGAGFIGGAFTRTVDVPVLP